MTIRIELLQLLPANDDNVIDMDHDNGTTTAEGCVLRCWINGTQYWTGNAKPGNGYATSTLEWPYADAYFWIAKGAVYLIRPDQPYSWKYCDDLGIARYIPNDPKHAIITTYTDVVCLDSAGFVRWRTPVAIGGIEITGESGDWRELECCVDPPDVWRSRRISISTGQFE